MSPQYIINWQIQQMNNLKNISSFYEDELNIFVFWTPEIW